MTLNINDFEYDDGNLGHFEKTARGIDQNLIMEVFLGTPVYAVNVPSATRSGTHQMIGPDTRGRCWTIIMYEVDSDRHIWRPITGWPSTRREKSLWQGEN